MTVLWWVLTDGHTGSWFIGIPVIVLATGASLLLQSHDLWKWRVAGLVRFFPLFLWLSFRAGFEVAIPAFHPRRPLAPGLLVYHLRLPIGPARIFFTNTVSLSPGTFSADLKEDQLTVHVLDTRRPVLENLQFMESVVAQLFGIPLSTERRSEGDRHG
jgi:multicomponent Na+:H+ antiporter subunit E